MSPSSEPASTEGAIAGLRRTIGAVQAWAQKTLLWGVWERMLETEFVDRSVALAGKAFVSFFPLVIVVAAFMPHRIQTSIFTSLTTRLGLTGHALTLAKEAFATSDDVRKATGVLGLVMTFFFASSFTTALQRAYLRAWRRPRDLKVGSYTRGLIWLAALLLMMTVSGALAKVFSNGTGLVLYLVLVLCLSVGWWWFTAWYLLLGHVRWRPLLPTAIISALSMTIYAISASVWMPNVVTDNLKQFGFFGIALALVTWFSGAAMCLIVGACAGPVLAEDPGPVGRFIRGGQTQLLEAGAPPSLGPPDRSPRIRDAFTLGSDESPDTA